MLKKLNIAKISPRLSPGLSPSLSPSLSPRQSVSSLISSGALWVGKAARAIGAPKIEAASFVGRIGVEAIDQTLVAGGLEFGAIHEWTLENSINLKERNQWQPPLFIFANIIHQVISDLSAGKALLKGNSQIFWIGRRCWPTPIVLETALPEELPKDQQCAWKDRCCFIDPADSKQRLSALIAALRSKAVVLVIADGSKLDAQALRRAQLAAAEGQTLCLLARPAWEFAPHSVAKTRWKIRATPSPTKYPRWSVELLRARGLSAPQAWELEWVPQGIAELSEDDAHGKENGRKDSTKSSLRLVSTALGGADQTQAATTFTDTDAADAIYRKSQTTGRRA